MVKVKYIGEVNPCNIKVNNSLFRKWAVGEVKDICPIAARKLIGTGKFTFANEVEKKVEIKKETTSLDLNDDGVVDSKDMSIAGEVLASGRKKFTMIKQNKKQVN